MLDVDFFVRDRHVHALLLGHHVFVQASLARFDCLLTSTQFLLAEVHPLFALGSRLLYTSSCTVAGGLGKALVGTISPMTGQDVGCVLHAVICLDGYNGATCLKLVLIVAGILWWYTRFYEIILDPASRYVLSRNQAFDFLKDSAG